MVTKNGGDFSWEFRNESTALPVVESTGFHEGFAYDPSHRSSLKMFRDFRFRAETTPVLRFLGYGLLLCLVWGYDQLNGLSYPIDEFAVVVLGYSVVSAGVLYFFYRPGAFWDFLFLNLDIPLFTAAVYFTGGVASWVYPLLLIRVADQAHTNCKRVAWFTHVVVACYLGMVFYCVKVDGVEINWALELVKIGFLYLFGWYVVMTSRTAVVMRERVHKVVRDATAMVEILKQQREHLQYLLRDAEAAQAAKETFLAEMSHELHTPLNSIMGFSALLSQGDKGELNLQQRKFIERIRESAERLSKAFDEVLSLSEKKSESKDTIHMVSLKRFVEDFLLTEMQGEAQELELKFKVQIPEEVTLLINKARLRLALQGILLRFIDLVKAKSTIGIVAHITSTRDVRLALSCAESDLKPGLKLTEDDIKAWRPLESNITRRHVEQQGGRIEWKVEDGKVMCWFLFPWHVMASQAEPETAAS